MVSREATSNYGADPVLNQNHDCEEEVAAQATVFRGDEFIPAPDFVPVSCKVAENDGVTTIPVCNTRLWPQSHDAATANIKPHCFSSFNVEAGPGALGKRGKCGNQYISAGYTQDFLDHDVCVQGHNGSIFGDSPWCGDEYDNAYYDFIYSSPFQCVSSAGPPGTSRMVAAREKPFRSEGSPLVYAGA